MTDGTKSIKKPPTAEAGLKENNHEKLGAIEAKYGSGVKFSILRPEATFVMESLMEDVSVEAIEREFKLEDLWTYYARSRKMREERLYEVAE